MLSELVQPVVIDGTAVEVGTSASRRGGAPVVHERPGSPCGREAGVLATCQTVIPRPHDDARGHAREDRLNYGKAGENNGQG